MTEREELKADDIDLSRLNYAELGRLHGRTGAELSRRNTVARFEAGEDDGGW